jgi:hypothetical protein
MTAQRKKEHLRVISSGQAILIRSEVAGESRRKGPTNPASARALRTASLIARYTTNKLKFCKHAGEQQQKVNWKASYLKLTA